MESKKKWKYLVLVGKLKELRRLLKRECNKKGKKIVALTLAMMFLFNMMPNIPMLSFLGEASVSEATEASETPTGKWSDYIDENWDGRYKIRKNNYTISTPAQLAAFAKHVNEGKTFEGKTVKLIGDIDLGAHYWVPIGTAEKPFKGTFDGGNKEIKGLYLQVNGDHTGLFGKSTGTIKNVNIKSGSMELYTTYDGVGGVVGYCIGAISNCKVNLSLIKGVQCVGGIVGDFRGSKISDCESNVSSIKGEQYVGGIVGKANSTSYISNCKATVTNIEGDHHIGGIAGLVNHVGMIDNCVTAGATANAQISGDSCVGGIVGGAYDNGWVYQSENNVAVSGRSTVGGIAGIAKSSIPIEYCSNHGSVSAEDQIGGIAGLYRGFVLRDCVNSGSVYGSFSGKDDDYCGIGGLVGNFTGTYVCDCINIGAVSGYRAGGLVGNTDNSKWKRVELDDCWWLVGEGCTTNTVESGGPLLGTMSPFEQFLAVGGEATIPANDAEAATLALKGSNKLGKDFKVTVEYEVSEPDVLDILKSDNATEYVYSKAAGTSDVIAKVTLKQNGLTDSGWTGSTLKTTTIQEKIGTVAVSSNQENSSTNGIIWVEIMEQGNYAGQSIWYGIDNSSGIFKEGSKVSITQIEEGTEKWNEYYSQIDDDKKAELAEGSLLMFDISIVDPDGNEYKNLPEAVSVYVQVGERLKEHLQKNNIRALFIQKGANENTDVTPALDMEYPGGKGDFVKLELTLCSPYAIYGKLANKMIQTGDENYNLIIVGLAAGLLASGASVLVFKRRKKYYID